MSERNVVYVGRRVNDVAVVVIEDPDYRGLGKPLNPRLDLMSHSPTGFEWGYAGSGPAQLALAILADAFSRVPNGDAVAVKLHQQFKSDFIVGIDGDTWEITTKQIREWLYA